MPQCLDVMSWRRPTFEETSSWLRQERGKRRANRSGQLVIRTQLRPVDLYAYLRARFGAPNGIQSILRRDDSDNWIHWDFFLKAGEVDVYISGTSRELHFLVSEKMPDVAWRDLVNALKHDFGRLGHAKSEMMKTFEKWVVFENKFATLANLCAELHGDIVEIPPLPVQTRTSVTSRRSMRKWQKDLEAVAQRGADLFGNCLKLRLITPIMAEAYINMLIVVYCRPEVRNDQAAYDAFIRAKLPDRLAALSENCLGFTSAVDQTTAAYGNFKRVMDKRNFALHGNIDPMREQLETVYFEGKRPLFADGGEHAIKALEQRSKLYEADEVIADYEATHLFLAELASYLAPPFQTFFDHVIGDQFPGYEVKQKRVTRLFPDQVVQALMPGLRYDDDLKVDW